MSEWEDNLPPIVRERLAKLGAITPEEKEKLKASEQLDSILSQFYGDKLDSDGLWKRLKVFKEEGKVFLLKQAQIRLIDSISLEGTEAEFKRRKAGILAIETLKPQPNTSVIEHGLNSVTALQTRHKKEIQQQYSYLKAEIEKNPELRIQQVKQGQSTVMVELTVDEAIKTNPEWKRWLAVQERRYSQEFAATMEKLKLQVR